MPITYETVTPTPIENATVQKAFLNGVPRVYYISANDDYVLHDNVLDVYEEFDEITGEPIGEPVLGYSAGTKSCDINYDWDANPREFYAVLKSTVPENQIF